MKADEQALQRRAKFVALAYKRCVAHFQEQDAGDICKQCVSGVKLACTLRDLAECSEPDEAVRHLDEAAVCCNTLLDTLRLSIPDIGDLTTDADFLLNAIDSAAKRNRCAGLSENLNAEFVENAITNWIDDVVRRAAPAQGKTPGLNDDSVDSQLGLVLHCYIDLLRRRRRAG
ncbi:MAG: hypothetical protein K1X78_03325 [Verrucomicrobiaceae bacterium]|nr:hypothetical protein [Verrucomicrobiaceae bacterium]